MSKEKACIISEALKYKSADEFIEVYVNKFNDLQDQVAKEMEAMPMDADGRFIGDISQLKILQKKLQELPDLRELENIWNKAREILNSLNLGE